MRVTDDQRAYIDEGVVLADRLLTRLSSTVERAERLLPLDEDRLKRLHGDELDAADLFLKRFQDAYEVGKNLFRSGLLLSGVGWPKLSYIHLVNEAERYGVLPSAEAWLDIMDVRNSAAHEYAMDAKRQAALLTSAITKGRVLLEQLGAALEFVRSQHPETARAQ